MKAIILAAGRGSRLGPLTQDQPKCLTQLLGRPLIEHQWDSLRKGGITDVGVVVGYQAEKLAHYPSTFFRNARWAESGIVESLRCAESWLSQSPCIVTYSDIVYDAALVHELIHHPGPIVVPFYEHWERVWKERFADPLSDAERFQWSPAEGRLTQIGGRAQTLEDIQGQYMGLFKLEPTGWQELVKTLKSLPSSEQDRMDMTSLLARTLERGVRIATFPSQKDWFEIDSPSDLAAFEKLHR